MLARGTCVGMGTGAVLAGGGGAPATPVLANVSAMSTDTNATGATNTVPGSPATNNIIEAHITIAGSSASVITPPAGEGWTLATRGDDTAGSGCTCATYWKRWGSGSTDNTSIAFTGTLGNMRLVLKRITGCKTSGNPYTDATSGGGGGAGTGTTMTAPTATGGTNKLVVRNFSGSAAAASGTPDSGTVAYSGASYAFTAGVDGHCSSSSTNSNSNPTGTATGTSTVALSNGWAASTLSYSG